MAYVSLYRKYRSQTFGDLVGQSHIVTTLQNGVTSGRMAHSFLFTGPRGTGKTSSARLLAKALCCEKGPIAEPCNECHICKAITQGTCIDVIEIDAASQTSIEDIREKILQVIEYMPALCRYKIFIIDEVHDLSAKAFDSLLKTIEEPPEHLFFVLATTEYNKVPPTIRSRCQKFEFHRASVENLIARLSFVAQEEGFAVEESALYAIARMADGGFRDALTLLEQIIISTSSNQITQQDVYDQLGLVTEETADQILESIVNFNFAALTSVLEGLTQVGRDPRSILESLLYRVADLTRISFNISGSEATGAPQHARSHDLAVRIGQERLLTIRSVLTEAHLTIRDISLPRLWLESELIRVAQLLQPSAALKIEAAKTNGQSRQEPVTTERAVAPAAKKSEAMQTPQRTDPVRAEAVVQAAPSRVLTGDPKLDRGAEIWSQALAALPPRTPITIKLENTRVVNFENNVLTVEVAEKSVYDWMMNLTMPRLSHVTKEVQKVAGENTKVNLQLGAGTPKISEPGAVELPAEGPKLAQLVREEFGS